MSNEFVKQVAEQKYEFGFTTDVHTEIIEKGLNEDILCRPDGQEAERRRKD